MMSVTKDTEEITDILFTKNYCNIRHFFKNNEEEKKSCHHQNQQAYCMLEKYEMSSVAWMVCQTNIF